jgi:hypothetical protein
VLRQPIYLSLPATPTHHEGRRPQSLRRMPASTRMRRRSMQHAKQSSGAPCHRHCHLQEEATSQVFKSVIACARPSASSTSAMNRLNSWRALDVVAVPFCELVRRACPAGGSGGRPAPRRCRSASSADAHVLRSTAAVARLRVCSVDHGLQPRLDHVVRIPCLPASTSALL